MKHSEFRAMQEAIEPLTRCYGISITFGAMCAAAKVEDKHKTGVKFTRNISPKDLRSNYVELVPDITHKITPDELRWMADVWDHFQRWLDDKEEWPLPE